MRINILTQPLFCNYGGILQNYALQVILRRMGHEPLTVNGPPEPPRREMNWRDHAVSVVNIMRRLQGKLRLPYVNPLTISRKEHELSFPQRDFVRRHINKVDYKAPFTSGILSELPADVWIVGSDQIWRPWCSHYINNCFFDFIPENYPLRRVAYAVSFGTDNWEIDGPTTESVRRLASRFDAVSVREKSGVDLSRLFLGIEAKHVVDPTLLLEADDYLSLLGDKTAPEKAYIAEYILDISAQKRKEIRNESKLHGLPILSIGRMRRKGFDSIESWLIGIANADRVVTDSFHGTVFSLIFRKPVKILTNEVRGNARLDSLRATLNLEPDSEGYYNVTPNVADNLVSLREESLQFLKDALA